MEKENNKYIYETTVNKEIIEQITEEREENGEKIKITRDSKKIKPVKIAVLKPDRKKYKEADIFYAKTLSNYLKEGLLPYSLVSKRYMNDGGPFTDNEKKAVNAMRNRYSELQEEYFKMEGTLTDEQNKRRGQILSEMTQINQEINQLNNSYSDIFENTAEAKTKNDIIEWWILNLSLINEEDKEYKLLYGDDDHDSKVEMLEKLEAKDDPFTNEVIKKLSYFVSFWYTSGSKLGLEEFKSAESYYDSNVSDYMKDQVAESKKEEPKSEVEKPTEEKKDNDIEKEKPTEVAQEPVVTNSGQ